MGSRENCENAEADSNNGLGVLRSESQWLLVLEDWRLVTKPLNYVLATSILDTPCVFTVDYANSKVLRRNELFRRLQLLPRGHRYLKHYSEFLESYWDLEAGFYRGDEQRNPYRRAASYIYHLMMAGMVFFDIKESDSYSRVQQ